jgi:hypothetical protein
MEQPVLMREGVSGRVARRGEVGTGSGRVRVSLSRQGA